MTSSRVDPDVAAGARWLRDELAELLAGTRGPGRVGLEVEVLPVDASSRRPLAPVARAEPVAGAAASDAAPALAPLLRAALARDSWRERTAPSGLPAFAREGGGVLSFEPGGQLEYASTPRASLDALQGELESVWLPLAAFLEGEGVALVARGLDPWNPVEAAVLHASGDRYRRMDAHYARRGAWGRRMMRQSAALHVNIDAPGPLGEAWAVANAAAPVLLAVFANSHRVAGRDAGVRSARAAQWRRLDPTRTGIVCRGGDPVDDYLDFALGADDFLRGDPGTAARPFRGSAETASRSDWARHLTTLFPEVRPRRYLELRSVDALPLRWAILPAAVLAGLLFDPGSRAGARRELPLPGAATLERAGCAGLADPGLAARAAAVLDRAQEGLEHLGDTVASAAVRDALDRFRARFTDRGRDPASALDDRFV